MLIGSRWYPGVVAVGLLSLCLAAGCRTPQEWSRLIRGNEELERQKQRLERELAEKEKTLTELSTQVETLKGFSGAQPADMFAPAKIELVKLTGGRDWDGQPGDDGVTVYLRPLDQEGDVVKVPGRITVQLLDNTNLSNPRVVALCRFEDPEEIRKTWHGRFLTNHFTLDCPFPPDALLPESGKLMVTATFTDFLTGKELTASKEVTFSRPAGEGTQVGASPP
jgi:hypothetical protein